MMPDPEPVNWDSLDDSELVHRVKEQPQLLEDLRLWDSIEQRCRLIPQGHPDEDLLQDALIAGLRALKKGSFTADCKNCMQAYVARCFFNAKRKAQKQNKQVSLEHPELIVARHADSSGTESDALRAALQSLEKTERDLLNRRFQDGQSFRELAAADGVPANTLKYRLAQILAKLRIHPALRALFE